MQTCDLTSLFISVFILSLTVADVSGTTHLNDSEKQTFSSKIAQPEKLATETINETDINKGKQSSDRKFINTPHGYKHSNEQTKEQNSEPDKKLLRHFTRQKRSILSSQINELRLQTGSNMAEMLKQLYSDYDYSTGIFRPVKRSPVLTLFDESPKYDISNRLTSNYGYGSRLQTPAKTSASEGGLFDVYSPVKRDILRNKIMESGLPELGYFRKRFSSDFGYGSREQIAENLAKSAAKGKIFGVYGPGKRSHGEIRYTQSEIPGINLFRKRFDSDFGYGSRETVAENLAKSFTKGKIFGIYGPGKRSGPERNTRGRTVVEADSGYGSRIQAGSQIAKDIVAIDNLFGLLGPGRRKR